MSNIQTETMIGVFLGLIVILISKYSFYLEEGFQEEELVEEEEELEEVVQIPKTTPESRFIYLTTDDTVEKPLKKYYNESSSRWYNNDELISTALLYFTFQLGTPTLKTSAENIQGVSIKNVKMVGPNSSELKPNYILDTFSVLFNFDMIDLLNERERLFMIKGTSQIEGSSPIGKVVSLSIIKTESVVPLYKLEVIFGGTSFAINFSEGGFMGRKNNFIGFSFSENKIRIYINDNPVSVHSLSQEESIILSNTPIEINTTGGLDMIVYNIAIYKNALNETEIENYKSHYTKHVTGLLKEQRRIEELEKQQLAPTKTIEKCSYDSTNLLEITTI